MENESMNLLAKLQTHLSNDLLGLGIWGVLSYVAKTAYETSRGQKFKPLFFLINACFSFWLGIVVGEIAQEFVDNPYGIVGVTVFFTDKIITKMWDWIDIKYPTKKK